MDSGLNCVGCEKSAGHLVETDTGAQIDTLVFSRGPWAGRHKRVDML